MKLYNTKTRKIEVFEPIEEGKVSLYVCGPTVYNHAHIGNARPLVVFDLLKRVLMAEGYDVKMVSNYTDIDDRIIETAIRERVSESVISERYIDSYNELKKRLHATHIDASPQVTQTMDEIIAYIEDMVAAGVAYVVDGDVYFSIASVSDYGALSHQNLDQLRVGARIDENDKKQNPLDFVLWKQTESGIAWDSPWSKGRPGWHTECVVMIHEEFQKTKIDIHAGGQDLRFPHHENEVAQNKAMHHHDLANYWMHNDMVHYDGEKMSKSLGNVVWAYQYLDELGSNVTRWLLLSTHYRLVLNITDEIVENVKQEVSRIEDALKQGSIFIQLNDVEAVEGTHEVYDAFLSAIGNDLNVDNAFVFVIQAIRQLNAAVRAKRDVYQAMATLQKMCDVLGLEFELPVLTEEDRALFESWDALKKEKQFEAADAIRKQLTEKGYL